MTVRIDLAHELAVEPDALLGLLTDPGYQQDKALHLGASRASCQRQPAPDGQLVLRLERTSFSDVSKKDETMVLTYRWHLGRREASWDQQRLGSGRKVVRAEGTSSIETLAPGRCRLTLQGELEVRVPLIGRRIERQVLAGVERDREEEIRFIHQRLGIG